MADPAAVNWFMFTIMGSHGTGMRFVKKPTRVSG